MLDDRVSKLGKASQRAAVLSLLGFLAVLSALGYASWGLHDLERQILEKRAASDKLSEEIQTLTKTRNDLLHDLGWSEKSLQSGNISRKDVDHSLQASAARRQIAARADAAARGRIEVQIFSRSVDRVVVAEALRELGFKVTHKESNPDIPSEYQTNAIFCGPKVPFEDVKLVALTLLRAGVQLEAIELFQSPHGRDYVIQIGSLYPHQRATPFSVTEINNMTSCE